MRYFLNIDYFTEFLNGSSALQLDSYLMEDLVEAIKPEWSWRIRFFKAVFDLSCGLVALPIIAFLSVVLSGLNPWLNKGPLFYSQMRAGHNGQEFRMWKFRTMVYSDADVRAPNARVEKERITRLGRFMRMSRIDELPNLVNVLRGEMSVIGPRPDIATHAMYYSGIVMGYAERHRVKPGITGLAQVEQGYTEDEDATAIKAKYDNIYVNRSCVRLDLYIIARTFLVMMRGIGAR